MIVINNFLNKKKACLTELKAEHKYFLCMSKQSKGVFLKVDSGCN